MLNYYISGREAVESDLGSDPDLYTAVFRISFMRTLDSTSSKGPLLFLIKSIYIETLHDDSTTSSASSSSYCLVDLLEYRHGLLG